MFVRTSIIEVCIVMSMGPSPRRIKIFNNFLRRNNFSTHNGHAHMSMARQSLASSNGFVLSYRRRPIYLHQKSYFDKSWSRNPENLIIRFFFGQL